MTRDEAKKKLWGTRNINTQSKVECHAIIDELSDTYEAEKREIAHSVIELIEMHKKERESFKKALIAVSQLDKAEQSCAILHMIKMMEETE